MKIVLSPRNKLNFTFVAYPIINENTTLVKIRQYADAFTMI